MKDDNFPLITDPDSRRLTPEKFWATHRPREIRAATPPEFKRINVNKETHLIRFENETESEVTIVIEPK